MSLRGYILSILAIPLGLAFVLIATLLATGSTLPGLLQGLVPDGEKSSRVLRLVLPEPAAQLALPEIEGPDDPTRPLVVIDAGHGGRDPGAVGEGVREKDVTLGLALALRDELLRQGGVRVALTRSDDRLLVLEERPEIARRMDADLFISIHADSAGEKSDVGGASIYTLSRKASSEAAARFAARENDADRLNGISIGGQSEEVSSILVELSQRRSQDESAEVARLIRREGEGVLSFHPTPMRSASLAVLRAPDMPSVLFESGFVTNPEDAERLISPEGRQRFGQTLARAIRIYFARQADI